MTIEAKIHKIILLIVVISFFLSCGQNKIDREFPIEQVYVNFKHVREVIDPKTDMTIGYEILKNPLTEKERIILMKILDKLHWPYKVSTEGEVLIQKILMPNLDNMSYLDGEITKELVR